MSTHTISKTLLAATAVVGLSTFAVTSPALAGNVWAIQTAPSPSTGSAIEGGGSWIVNKPSGYYLGRAVVGSEFDVVQTSGANWHYGRAISTVNMCGWVMPGSMWYKIRTVNDSCSEATKSTLWHRLYIGKDFNAPAHATGDGTDVWASNCPVYLNYFYGTDFASNGGRWNHYAGTVTGVVKYRFTTRDGGARVVRVPSTTAGGIGWGFMPSSCVPRSSAVYNDND
jgi:hypothetical protein